MKQNDFVIYAHRGASHYCPENTMMAFYMGMQMGANGIETDVRRTRDGLLVLFHDETLTRVTGAEGSIADYTYDELQKLLVKKEICTIRFPRWRIFSRISRIGTSLLPSSLRRMASRKKSQTSSSATVSQKKPLLRLLSSTA